MVINPTAKNTLGYMRLVDHFYLLPAAKSPMSTTPPDTCANLANALLTHYSFDLNGYSANELITLWQTQYPSDWLHLAVIEALYQGRYKGISAQQILAFWLRRGQVIHHFNMEFQRLICGKFPANLTESVAPVLPPVQQPIGFEKVINSQPPEQIENGNGTNHTQALQLINFPQEPLSQEEKQTDRILAASGVGISASAVQPRLNPQDNFSTHALTTKLLPIAVTRPPIGQFTPQTSDRSESFTSKLKAISGDNTQASLI